MNVYIYIINLKLGFMKIMPLVLLLISLKVTGQKSDTTIYTKINNSRTAAHINIPGTKIFVIPPTGYVVSKQIAGFQKGNNKLIDVKEASGQSYFDFDFSKVKGYYASNGAKVIEEKAVSIQGYQGFFTSLDVKATRVSFLVFGDKSFYSTIIIAAPIDEKNEMLELVKALNSVWYGNDSKPQYLELAGFTIDETLTRLKHVGNSPDGNVFVYFEDGKQDTIDKKRPFLIIGKLPMPPEGVNMDEVKEFTRKLTVDKYEMTETVEKNFSKTSINGYKTMQIDYWGKIDGIDALVYVCFVTNDKSIYLLHGVARKELTLNAAAFRKFAGSFRIKE